MYENLINYCSNFITLSVIEKEAIEFNFKHITIKRNDFLLKEGKCCTYHLNTAIKKLIYN